MLNKCELIGNIGADPELRHLDGDRKVVTFSLATCEVYKNRAGEKIANTTWHRCVAWGRVGEIIEQYTSKGSRVYVGGKITNRTYTDRQGNDRYITEVVVRDVVLLDSKQRNESVNPTDQGADLDRYDPQNEQVDNLPF